MTIPEMDRVDAMSSLLEHVVDSFEKLEILVHLYRMRSLPQGASAIGRAVQLSSRAVAEALAALFKAGVVRTAERDDCAPWWFDSRTPWATTIEILVAIYDVNRGELLDLMKNVAIERLRRSGVAVSTFPAAPNRRRAFPS